MTNIRAYFNELYDHKNLIYILAKRDIKVRYNQTLLGIVWAIIKPISTLFIFLFMFKKIANIKQINGIPIQLIILSGVIFWNYFSSTLNNVSNSITTNINLVTKIYFPRLILVISSLSVCIVDFLLSLLIFIFFSLLIGNPIQITYLLFPVILLLISFFSIGLGLFFAANSIKYRDLQHVNPLIIQYGFFITPVIYSVQSINFKNYIELYYLLNPLVGIIELGRFFFIQSYAVNFQHITLSIISSIIFLMVGIFIFIKKENSFVDYL
jgi:lipopolysaccharide transport system permease protein